MNLIDQLLKQKVIDKKTADSLVKDAEDSSQTIEEIILAKQIFPEDRLFQIKSEALNIPLKNVVAQDVPVEILELIPQDSAEHYKMVPIEKRQNMLEVAMVYPEDLKAQEALNFLARKRGFNYRVSLITLSGFQDFLKKYQNLGREVKTALQELEKQLQPGGRQESPSKGADQVAQKKSEAPISKTVAVILKHAVEGKASDIHIEPMSDRSRVRFRLDGVLHSSLFLPIEVHPSIVARIKIISKLKIDETRIPQDGRFSVNIDNQNIDFRVSTFPTTLGEKVVMRVLNPDLRVSTFEELGITGRNLEILKRAVAKPYGMILSTGPTGSGKTTTLYVVLDSVNKEGVNIITLEDPVEYFIAGVSQSQIKPEIGYTFATGLRHVLRQDPDIIMVGEIRDNETAELAVHAALTGHLVLSTIHTNDSLGAIPRMIDLGVRPFLLPSSINAIIAQRLVRKLCPNCRKKILATGKIKELILEEMNGLPDWAKEDYKISGGNIQIWEPVGCNQCGESGYAGRVGIFEILEMTKALGDIVISEPSEKKLLVEAHNQGMISMRQDGILKVLNGTTSIEEVMRSTSEE
ncbi:MAG: GspE/PulE family protein [Candidatus Parcubacteria bacterium]|nr:GspE/PulE family protein [Candidatus Parcubacteria bacterium]